MANISDFSDALTQEAFLAKKYAKLAAETNNEEYKKILEQLAELSDQKMQLVHKLIVDIPWFK